jgi:ankyrin repeat protein
MHAAYCNADIFNILFELYDDIPTQLKARDNFGNTLFLYTVYSGNKDIIKKIISNGANIYDVNNDGETALMAAKDSKDVFKYLYSLGLDSNLEDKNGYTALMKTIMSQMNPEKEEIITYLIKSGAKLKNTNNVNLLMAAVKYGKIENVKFLINRYNIDVNEQDDKGLTALMYLVKHNSKKPLKHRIFPIIKLLLEKGANEELTDENGYT